MKNRQAILIIGSVMSVLLCCGALTAWGIYSLVNNPTVKKGVELFGDEFKTLMELQEKIYEACDCENIEINFVNGDTFNVSLINSKFNDLPELERAEKARKMAKLVKENYTGQAPFTRIVIIFVQNAKAGPVNANSTSSYPFDVSELK